MIGGLAVVGLLAAAAVCGLVALDLGLRPAIPGARALAVGCVGAAIWCAGYAAELELSDVGAMMAATRFEYLGIVLAALFLFVGVSAHTGLSPLPGPALVAVAVLPAATLVLVATNTWHGLVWERVTAEPDADGLVLLHPTYGPWFWVHIAWTYALLALSAGMILVAARRTGSAALRAALVAVVAPWVGNALYLAGLTPVDPTPFCVAAGAVALAVALQRHELLAGEADAGAEDLRALLDSADDIVFTAGLDGRLRTLNRAGRELYGIEAGAVPERRVADLAPGGEGDDLLVRLLSTGTAREAVSVRDQRGELHAIEIRAREVSAADGERLVRGIARDVTAHRRHEAELARRLHHDDLTGLANRTLLHERLGLAALEAARGGAPFALVVVDVDRFKELNAHHGQAAGDELLRELARRLARLTRGDDVLARIGGDRFAVLAHDVGSERVAEEIGRRILDAVSVPVSLRGTPRAVGASVGVALAPAHGPDATALLTSAEVAMRAAKQAHVGVVVFGGELEAQAKDRVTLTDDLRRALADGDIEVVYQPQVALYDNRTVGIEALARWTHPRLGPIPPNRFIRLAEDAGLVGQLDGAVLAHALGDLARLHGAGHALQLAVNLSPRDLADPRLAERVADATAAAGIDARHLTVEMTESTVMRDPAHDGQVLRRLRDAGAAVAIDDFGTGYSSLAYLSELPVAELKIDRAFVRGAVDGTRDRAIVRTVASLGRDLGLRVCAEGVEDARALDLVRELGCATAQGYHIARPMPFGALEGWLQTGLRRRAQA